MVGTDVGVSGSGVGVGVKVEVCVGVRVAVGVDVGAEVGGVFGVSVADFGVGESATGVSVGGAGVSVGGAGVVGMEVLVGMTTISSVGVTSTVLAIAARATAVDVAEALRSF